MVKIEISRKDNDFLMEATNEAGRTLQMDAGVADGGHDLAFRPMQVLLAALGGCSSIDVISILKKQRADLKDIKITITGEREKGAVPSLYTNANLHFKIFGNIEEEKVKRAIELSMTKYCSVAKTMEKTAVITSSYEIIPA